MFCLFITTFNYQISYIEKKNYICKDSICDDPKLVLSSYVKGPNNKICREWAKRLGLGHRTVINHGVHSGRTEVN